MEYILANSYSCGRLKTGVAKMHLINTNSHFYSSNGIVNSFQYLIIRPKHSKNTLSALSSTLFRVDILIDLLIKQSYVTLQTSRFWGIFYFSFNRGFVKNQDNCLLYINITVITCTFTVEIKYCDVNLTPHSSAIFDHGLQRR